MLTLRNTKGSPLTYTEMDANLTYLESIASGSGGGLEGTQYILVTGDGTPTENGTELEEAYITAKTMSPTVDNRITVIVFPGEYGLSEKLVLDTPFIDLVSVTGNRDVILDRADVIGDPFGFTPPSTLVTSDALLIDVDNVYVKGMVGKLRNSPNFLGMMGTSDYILPLQVGDNLPNVVVDNCKGGFASFGSTPLDITPKEINGTYINVETNGGFNGTASGTFTNCVVGAGSFGGFGSGGIASGTFTNCIGGDRSFGGGAAGGIASGTFTDCIGGDGSFGGGVGGDGGTASGTFINCVGGDGSFGGFDSIIDGTASGTFTNCIGGTNSFGVVASGTFTNCIGGNTSFGGTGTISGKLYYCRLTSGTFKVVSSGGRTYFCIDGFGVVNNQ